MLYALVVCALAAFSVAAQINLSGTWQIEYHDKNGKEVDTPMVSFLQHGWAAGGSFRE